MGLAESMILNAENEIRILETKIADWTRSINEYQAEINSGTLTPLQKSSRQRSIDTLQNNITAAQLEIQRYRNVIAKYQQSAEDDAVLPPTSTGETTALAQQARDDGASAGMPVIGQQVLYTDGRIGPYTSTANTNAIPTPTNDGGINDFGTDAQLRTLAESQAITNNSNAATSNITYNEFGEVVYQGVSGLPDPGPVVNPDDPYSLFYADGGDAGNYSTNVFGPGVGAVGDDVAGLSTKNSTQTSIDSLYGSAKVVPQPNVLDQYASYTYQISVYLMDAAGYSRLIKTKTKNLSGYALLFQSGGAPVGGRNPYFSLDYYVDNVEIHGLVSGKGTGSPHNSTSMKFTVIEPNGITLVQNLNDAVLSYIYKGNSKTMQQGAQGQAPWGGQNYLMVINFYGYDQAGNLVRGGTQTPQGGANPQAVITKYIPFQIANLNFKVGSRAVEYNFDCVTPANIINAGQYRATIQYDVEIAAMTLKEALAGSAETTVTSGDSSSGIGTISGGVPYPVTPPSNPAATPAPATANSAPSKKLTVTKGLFAALNQYQAELVAKKQQSLPDIFEIEFASAAIANAKVTFPGGTNLATSSMAKGGTAADQLNPQKQSADTTTNTLRAKAGTQIVQFLEQIVRNSTYIQDQQSYVIDPKTGKQTPQKTGNNLAWFRVGFSAEPIAWDDIRNDYQYRIKYVITPYRVQTVDSSWFPTTSFNGVHKHYPYWFTGQNSSVLSYEQTYNNLYYRILSGAAEIDTRTSDINDLVRKGFSPRSGQSNKGAAGRVNEPAANAADKLYSPEDLASAEIKIIGDPAWIFQGELATGASATAFKPDPFFTDGTINAEASQIYFDIEFNLVGDYNLNTGLMEKGKTGST